MLMKNSQTHPLYIATKRLVDAMDRLEHNMQGITVAHDRALQKEKQLIVFERENSSLLQEREGLSEALAQLQHQYDDLYQTASVIQEKLDDSILRLTHIIEE